MTEESIYLRRQILIVIAVLSQCSSLGLILSYPAVLNPAILSTDSTDIRATPDQASWLSSIVGISGAVAYVILSPLMDIWGRRIIYIVLNVTQVASWTMIWFADSVELLFFGRILQGLGFGVLYINGIIVGEYLSPVRRGYIICIQKMCMAIGNLFCHSMTLYSLWRQTAAVGALLSVVAVIISILWPESPAFLAMTGRFEECKKSFIWLQGDSLQKKEELADLILAQREIIKKRQAKKKTTTAFIKGLLRNDFLKPLFISILLTICIDTSGRYYILVYVIQIMNVLFEDKSLAVYYTIAGDGLTIFALFVSGFIIRYIRRRVVLLAFGFTSSFIMFAICLAVYLKSNFNVTFLVWLSPCLILCQILLINMSLIPVCFVLMAEIFPLEHRAAGSSAAGVVFSLLYALTLKVTPIMMNDIGVEGTYFIYGLCLLICLIVLYFIVPETKNRTLQDIENEIKNVKATPLEMTTILHKEIDVL